MLDQGLTGPVRGLDRYLLEDYYTHGLSELDMAQKLGMDIREVNRRLNSALWYLCGRWKLCSYREFRGHRINVDWNRVLLKRD